jgi:hypothetical protein
VPHEIPTVEHSMTSDDDLAVTDKGITQAQVYDNLKRIGELEDQKKSIQDEIQNRTEQLRDVIAHIDRGSILHKMLEAALKDFRPTLGSAHGGKRAAKGANASSQGTKKKSRRK